jgi:hypothetical protein
MEEHVETQALVRRTTRGCSQRRLSPHLPLRALMLTLALFVVSGCGGGQATIKYTRSDAHVAAGQTTRWSFDTDQVGSLPAGATAFSGAWAVRAEADAPSPTLALCQTGTAEFPALRLSETVYADSTISARFKPISGTQDRAGGIIFRVQDKDNHYILRGNALEGTLVFFKYTGGVRSELKSGAAPVTTGMWQELRVEARGSTLQGYYNGQLIVETTDETFQAGQIGVWTKADSVTCFDDVQVTAG